MELFEKIAEKGGVLLKVDWNSPSSAAENDETRASAILLTFDLGRILVTANPGRALEVRQLESEEEAGGALAVASEDEPWWRVLGSPLARAVDEEGDGGGLRTVRLQFRPDDQNPRFILLQLDAGLVRARLEDN